MLKKCICGNEFITYKKPPRGKYCSKECAYKNAIRPSGLRYDIKVVNKGWIKIGQRLPKRTWNDEQKKLQSERLKDKRFSIKTEFKKGQASWNKGIIYFPDEKHCNWAGDKVGYNALHSWISRKLGKASWFKCSCGKQAQDWSNIDHKYKRILNNYMALCKSCHKKYDYGQRKK